MLTHTLPQPLVAQHSSSPSFPPPMSRQPKPDPGLPTPPAHLTAAASSSSTSNSPLPTSTNYTDFILRSSASSSSSGVKHNVMKFNALGSRSIDPANDELFTRPVKLNRKDPRTVRRLTDADRERHNKRAFVKAAKKAGRGDGMDLDDVKEEGEDGVKGEVKDEDGAGEDGKETKETLDAALVGKGANGAGLPNRRGPGGQFKKKTKRVYVSSEEARRLKREEWQPWVLEDDEGKERWIGRLEGGAGEVEGAPPGSSAAKKEAEEKKKAGLQGWRPAAQATSEAGGGGSSYVAFVFGDNGDEFKVVPISRWYRFNQGPKYLTLAEEEAEVEVRSPFLSTLTSFAHCSRAAVRTPTKVERTRALDHAPSSRSRPLLWLFHPRPLFLDRRQHQRRGLRLSSPLPHDGQLVPGHRYLARGQRGTVKDQGGDEGWRAGWWEEQEGEVWTWAGGRRRRV